MPTVPGAGLIVIEAEFAFGGLEAILDRPAPSLDGNQGLEGGLGRAPGGEVGARAVADGAPDQQAAGPQAGAAAVLLCLKVSQFEIALVLPFHPAAPDGTFASLAQS